MTPDEFTNEELMLDVGDGHTLYVHDWGKQDTESTIMHLHGGPGGGCSDRAKVQYDPTRQHVIFFDQRGSGRSLPHGSLEKNDTAHLLADIDKILDRFNIEKAILVGGSWGCALALFYAATRPERVQAMVLDGIWAGTAQEADWIDKGGFRTFFPDIWATYLAATPQEYRDDPSKYHFGRILGDDPVALKESAYAYRKLEGAALSLDDRYTPEDFEEFDPSDIRLEVHYLANHCFMPDRYVFANAESYTMPIYLVQGRYDMICPPKTAYELHQVLPTSELFWTISGHKSERESWNVKRSILLGLMEGK